MSDSPFQPSDPSRTSQELDGWWSNAYNRVTGGQGGRSDQWLRKINLTVYDAKGQDAGAGIDLSNLRIEFSATKQVTASPNLLTARVYNLSPQTMQRVLNFRRVVLAAGYQSGNFGVIFDGTVVLYVRGKETAVDTYLEIFAGDADQQINNAVVTLTWPAGTTPTQKAKDAIAAMHGVELGEVQAGKGEPKTLRSSSYCGMARDCIRDQTNAVGADFFVEDGRAHVIPRLGYRAGEQVNLAPTTGLIGMPRVTPSGIEATCLLNPKLRLAGLVGIQSTLLSNVPFEPGSTEPFATAKPQAFAATGPGERHASASTHRRALRGDADALREIEAMWSDYQDIEIACFLCDAPVERPPFTMMLPENRTRAKIIGAPLCVTCRGLPQMIRLNRCLSLLRKMYAAKDGRQVHFSFNPGRR